MGPQDQQLVVIRGNSASGKSTLANELQLAMGRGTANIGQDHFRRIVLREHDVADGANITLIRRTIETCFELGFHVIVEGIFVASHYGEMLRAQLAGHPGPAHAFYLHAPLDLTLARHAGRPLSQVVPADRLREWYLAADPLDVPGEVMLDAALPTADLVAQVLQVIGPVVPIQPTSDRDPRFL